MATVAVGRTAASYATEFAMNSFALMACAKPVSHISPAWGVDARRAKRFAQFRIAKVPHSARHTGWSGLSQRSFRS